MNEFGTVNASRTVTVHGIFNKNGNFNNAANYNNWEDKRYYLGQYRFVVKHMKKIIANILSVDPHSIIIIESDHGPRFSNEISQKDKTNILNAVYFEGNEIIDIEGKSSVNTLRAVFNKLFDSNLVDVEVSYEN